MITASHLTLAYQNEKGYNEVIKNASFAIRKGEFIFITGPSGSGKSTLLKSLYGEMKPIHGTLHINGADMTNISSGRLQKLRTELGIIFQNYRLINEWTIAKNIVLPLIIAGYNQEIQNAQANRLLRHIKLSELADRYPLELSGGEQQRVGLARAISKNPVIILADEPTGNLDKNSSNVIWDLLESACLQFGSTIIVVTHKIPELFSLPYRHFIIEGKGIYETH